MSRTAVVWGAGGGIGRALVERLGDEGWEVFAVARHAKDLESVTPHVVEADVAAPRQVEAAVYAIATEMDSVDLWIYAVGDIASTKVADMEPQDWDRILSANLSGAYLATHFSMPILAEDAHLVYIGAVSERLRLPGLSAYAAAKAGLEAYAEALGKEERKKRVTVVRPSAVVTPLWDKVPMRVPADAPGPEKVAARIVEAYEAGHKGVLDLTG
jgi:3-oxoacyl-[acyl-carrier protein] reductase